MMKCIEPQFFIYMYSKTCLVRHRYNPFPCYTALMAMPYWLFYVCFTLWNLTTCLSWHNISFPVHVELDIIYTCIYTCNTVNIYTSLFIFDIFALVFFCLLTKLFYCYTAYQTSYQIAWGCPSKFKVPTLSILPSLSQILNSHKFVITPITFET